MFRSLGKNATGDDPVRGSARPRAAFFDPRRVSRGLLAADFDDDGDQDLFVVRMDAPPAIGRNDTASPGHWIGALLVGKAPNRDAIGAVLVVEDSAGIVPPRRADVGRRLLLDVRSEALDGPRARHGQGGPGRLAGRRDDDRFPPRFSTDTSGSSRNPAR